MSQATLSTRSLPLHGRPSSAPVDTGRPSSPAQQGASGPLQLFQDNSFAPAGPTRLASKAPHEQSPLERVTNFFKGFGLGAVETAQALGQQAKTFTDVNLIMLSSSALAEVMLSPLTGKSPGQILNEKGQRAQEAGRALLQQTSSLLKLASDLSTPVQVANFLDTSKSTVQDLLALQRSGKLTLGTAMEALRTRTGQNPSVQAAQSVLDSMTNYKAILESGDPTEVGRGAFRIFTALAPFAKAKVAGHALPKGAQALPRPQGITSIVHQPKPAAAAGYRGTLARVPNDAVGRAYVQAYDLADDLVRAQGGRVQGIGGSIAEGRGRLATFDRKVWTPDNAQRLDKLPIDPNVPLPPEMEALARQLPPGSIEAKLAGGKTIPSDLDVVIEGLSYTQQKAIKAEVFNRTGVLVEFVKPNPAKAPATGLTAR